MIVPLLLTAGILGATYYFGQTPAPSAEPTTSRVVPPEQISQPLRDQMQRAIFTLPPNLQAQIPTASWGDPSAWIRLAQQAPQQSPELNAIALALQAIPPLPIPTPQPPFTPGPPVPLDLVPPGVRAQLGTILQSLPAEYQNAIPGLNPALPPPVVPVTVDPAALVLLANTIQAQLGQNHPAPPQLRSIAQQLSPQARAPVMNMSAAPAMNMSAVANAFASPAPVSALGEALGGEGYREAVRTYEGIQNLLQQYGGMSGAPARIGQDPMAECEALWVQDIERINREAGRRESATYQRFLNRNCGTAPFGGFTGPFAIEIGRCEVRARRRIHDERAQNQAWHQRELANAARRYEDCVRVVREAEQRARAQRAQEAIRAGTRTPVGERTDVLFPRGPAAGPFSPYRPGAPYG